MKGLVIDHNDIDDSHTCSYALTSSQEGGQVNEFGVLSSFEEDINTKDPGAEVVRRALRNMIEKDGRQFTIYNYSDYHPQLEISRFPYEIRERAYENKNYKIRDSATGTFSHTGGFLANAAVDFISSNYSRFDNPVSTEKPPKPVSTSSEPHCKYKIDGKATYYLYTDASYHPDSNNTGISFVIVGENGGMYGLGSRVEPQIIVRAELLALINGVKTIQDMNSRSEIVAHTDCMDVVRAVNEELKIDRVLQNKMKELHDKSKSEINVSCIDREANELADSLAKVGRSRGKILVGKRG